VHVYRYGGDYDLVFGRLLEQHCPAKQERMIIMTDISFSVPAKLLASEGHIGLHSTQDGSLVDKGSLGRLVGRVMDTEPGNRWRYSIFAEGTSYLHAHEIEALASTRRYADWHAGQG
jgi:hypothetical protein